MKIACLFVVSFFSAVVASAAGEPAPALPRSTPEAQGVSSAAMLELVEALEERVNEIHSIIVVRNGYVITEGWWAPFAADEPHMMFSLSKSFTSTAVGLAIAEGKLSLDDQVTRFFPDDLPAEPSANLRAMRVRDLLTMTTGQHEQDFQGFPYNDEESAVKKFLALPVTHKPGTYWVYNTPATFMLSAIVQKVTGATVHDYLRPRLYEPLGIEGAEWEANKQGISMGGFGLEVKTEDIARFGQFLLQKGNWHGKQLVPAEWIEAASARQASNGSSPTSDWEQGYGYQFWRCRNDFYRGDGAHGQFCMILERFDTVVAITSGTANMASVMNTVWEKLVPALEAAEARPADVAAHEKLRAKLASLTLATPKGYGSSPAQVAAIGKRFVFPDNPRAIEAIAVEAMGTGRPGSSNDVALTMKIGDVTQRIEAGLGEWKKGTIASGPMKGVYAAAGAWTADDTYTLKLVRYHTPFVTTYRLKFAGDELVVDTELNVGPENLRNVQLTGKAAVLASKK